MKLLTHNMMQSHVKGITKRFPLLIKPADDGVRIVEQVRLVCIRVSKRLGSVKCQSAAIVLGFTHIRVVEIQ